MASKPPRRSGARSLFGLAVAAVVGVGAWQGWSWWSWANAPVQAATEAAASPVQLEIASGTSAYQIGQQLEESGLIRSGKAWDMWVRWQSLQQKLGRSPGDFQAGVYELSPSSSMLGLARQIREGKVIQSQFTIPEGWNIRQMAAYFEAQGFFPAAEFLAAVQQIPRDRYTWLPANIPHLEGYLFPDTYQIDATQITSQGVIDTMLRQFENQALPLYQQADTTLSLAEWVNFSSIVEKEAVIPTERPLIAGVLAHRLRIGKNLEVDPTVEYGLGISQTPDRTLTFAEVATPSPYNSYLNPGLPPTPIASPGLASLKATFTPEDTDYLFYVARYDGSHVFSRTFEEHLSAQDEIHDARDAKSKKLPRASQRASSSWALRPAPSALIYLI
ncbi:MAG: endolytic transglycosylase MltG [Synechococcales cyanobacterium RU_4_20]|nr:endolytic transglycosylase MltG [Synechococcales cyanobacterium RU_4_20]